MCEGLRNLGVGDVAVDEPDARAVTAASDQLCRLVMALPCLPDDRQLVALRVDVAQQVERAHKILDTLERPDDAEVEQPADASWLPRAGRGALMLEERVRDRLGAILRDAVAARDELAVMRGMDDEASASAEQARRQRSDVPARQRPLALAHVLGLVELDHRRGHRRLARDYGQARGSCAGLLPSTTGRRRPRGVCGAGTPKRPRATEPSTSPRRPAPGCPASSSISLICAPTRVRPG